MDLAAYKNTKAALEIKSESCSWHSCNYERAFRRLETRNYCTKCTRNHFRLLIIRVKNQIAQARIRKKRMAILKIRESQQSNPTFADSRTQILMVILEYEIMTSQSTDPLPNLKFRALCQNSKLFPNTETKLQAGHKTENTDFLTYTASPNPLFQSFFS